jgi:hypothetical protein
MTRERISPETSRRHRALDAALRHQVIARTALSVVERAISTGETLEAAASGFLLGQPDADLAAYEDILAQARIFDAQAGPPYLADRNGQS